MNDLTPSQKEQFLIELTTALFKGEITQGELLKKLRSEYLDLTQDAYAKLVGISRRSLHEVESDRRQLNLSTLNKVFSPLGFSIGLIPKSPYVLKAASANIVDD
jgi:DNA-binding XRE family transcriptional regulator